MIFSQGQDIYLFNKHNQIIGYFLLQYSQNDLFLKNDVMKMFGDDPEKLRQNLEVNLCTDYSSLRIVPSLNTPNELVWCKIKQTLAELDIYWKIYYLKLVITSQINFHNIELLQKSIETIPNFIIELFLDMIPYIKHSPSLSSLKTQKYKTTFNFLILVVFFRKKKTCTSLIFKEIEENDLTINKLLEIEDKNIDLLITSKSLINSATLIIFLKTLNNFNRRTNTKYPVLISDSNIEKLKLITVFQKKHNLQSYLKTKITQYIYSSKNPIHCFIYNNYIYHNSHKCHYIYQISNDYKIDKKIQKNKFISATTKNKPRDFFNNDFEHLLNFLIVNKTILNDCEQQQLELIIEKYKKYSLRWLDE